MSFSNRILKVGTVAIDSDNRVVIDIGPQAEQGADDDVERLGREPLDTAAAEAKAGTIIHKAKRQAEQIINDARITATAEQSKIIQEAEAEAAKILSEVKDRAYNEGMAAATEEGEAIKAEAEQVLKRAEAARKAMHENLEPEMVNLVIDIIEKLLLDTVTLNPAVIVNLIKQGLSSATITGEVKVYVSEQDFKEATERKDELLALTDGSVKLELVKDLSLNPTDCVIETPFGSIDASLGQQYETLRENLTYLLETR